MSILGYSTSYFLPSYWADTPLYGEKIIPLLDYLLSTEFEGSDGLAQAFYNVTGKYKNTTDLPIGVVEEIIDENGYSYVKALLGDDEEGLRLLLTLMVLIHELKGTKLGIQVVLNLLKRDNSIIVMQVIGKANVDSEKNASNFSLSNYVVFKNYSAEGNEFEIDLRVSGFNLSEEQCIVSVADYGLYIGIDREGHLVLSLGSDRLSWNILNNVSSSRVLVPGSLYYLKLQYDGYEYSLKVSTDGKNYTTWISEESSTSLGIYRGTMYLGVDYSEGVLKSPFSGVINFSDFSVETKDTEIIQWFEQTPVEAENTFIIKTEIDTTLVSSEFFRNLANFIRRYVYPTLKAFTAKLTFNSYLTFLPYVRQRVMYVAQEVVEGGTTYLVKHTPDSAEATDTFYVSDGYGGEEQFEVADDNGEELLYLRNSSATSEADTVYVVHED